MTIVGLLKGLGIILFYGIISATIAFCAMLFIVLACSRIRSKRGLSDAFYDGAVKAMIWGSAALFALLVVFGPFRLFG